MTGDEDRYSTLRMNAIETSALKQVADFIGENCMIDFSTTSEERAWTALILRIKRLKD